MGLMEYKIGYVSVQCGVNWAPEIAPCMSFKVQYKNVKLLESNTSHSEMA